MAETAHYGLAEVGGCMYLMILNLSAPLTSLV